MTEQKIENEKKNIVIVAPHPDDEIIGTYEILKNNRTIIIYTTDLDNIRKEETLKLKDHFDIKIQLYLKSIPMTLLNKNSTFYFPDPIYEVNPDHRLQGSIGEQLARAGHNIIFYSINMNAPYCHNVINPNEKENSLNKIYSSQNDLWKYEKKYILFEGRCKWLF